MRGWNTGILGSSLWGRGVKEGALGGCRIAKGGRIVGYWVDLGWV